MSIASYIYLGVGWRARKTKGVRHDTDIPKQYAKFQIATNETYDAWWFKH